MTSPIVYKAVDRSILLPFYKRYLVDPGLRFVPASVNPNTITHIGHVFCLLGAVTLLAQWPKSGWPFVVAAVLLQVYLWCDNADGGHARRTNQSSAFGEFLDHGLDCFNTTYIALVSAMALGAPPLWWVGLLLLIPAAAAATFWEQSLTGTFQAGMLNQIESLCVVTMVLIVSAVLGTDVWGDLHVLGMTPRAAMLTWTMGTLVFGLGRNAWRVYRHGGARAVIPIVPLLTAGVGIVLGAAGGGLTAVSAVVLAAGSNLLFAIRALSARVHGQTLAVEPLLVGTGLLSLSLGALGLAGQAVAPEIGTGFACAFGAIFAVRIALTIRGGMAKLRELEDGTQADRTGAGSTLASL
jgi:phosphatidylglycerophosphate synthase